MKDTVIKYNNKVYFNSFSEDITPILLNVLDITQGVDNEFFKIKEKRYFYVDDYGIDQTMISIKEEFKQHGIRAKTLFTCFTKEALEIGVNILKEIGFIELKETIDFYKLHNGEI